MLMVHEAATHGGGNWEGAWGDSETVGKVEVLTGDKAQGWTDVGAEVSQCWPLWPPSLECCWGYPDSGGWTKSRQLQIWCIQRRRHATCSHEHTGEGTPPLLNGETGYARTWRERWHWPGCVCEVHRYSIRFQWFMCGTKSLMTRHLAHFC